MFRRFALVLVSLVLWLGVAHAQGNYLIQPGDRLAIEILEDNSLNRQALVLPDGRFSFPLAGPVIAGGRTTDQVQRAIASRISSNFSVAPTVFVSVVGIAPESLTAGAEAEETMVVYLLGEVNSPGPKAVLPGTTILQMLAQSGGFTRYAATKRLQLRRRDPNSGRQQMYKINFKAIAHGAAITSDPTLIEGDVLLVPERRLFE